MTVPNLRTLNAANEKGHAREWCEERGVEFDAGTFWSFERGVHYVLWKPASGRFRYDDHGGLVASGTAATYRHLLPVLEKAFPRQGDQT